MRKPIHLAILLLLVSAASAQSGTTLPRLVTEARYIMVTNIYGVESQRVMPEDRLAVADVESAIRKWGRYKLAYKQEDADLLLVVRRGRVAGVGVRGQVGNDRPDHKTTLTGPVVNEEAGPWQDMLSVHDAHAGVDSPALWRAFEPGGLDRPEFKLVQKLRADVERSAKKP